MGIRVGGVQRRSLIKLLHRFLRLPLLFQQNSEMAVGLGECGIVAERFSDVGFSLVQLP